jgi:prolyl-tRNA synthetase
MMYWSKLFIPTLREGANLLERAGYMRELGAGERSYLFLGRRSQRKIEQIVREELDAIGAQEVEVFESSVMDVLARELRSHRQLPQIWYQFWPGDADLIGAPWHVTVGKRVEQGLVEVVERRTKERTDVPVSEVVAFLGPASAGVRAPQD